MNLSLKELRELGIGWRDFCDVTGYNVRAIKEGMIDDDTVLYVSLEDWRKLQEMKK